MNKTILFLILLPSILAACAAPQVTVPSTPLPSETPIPTPTLHPQFAEIQEQVSASGGRFNLQADGTIQDGAEPIPGITIALDGTISLTVNGESVTLDPADVNFDDESGISIDGFELNEDGEWVEAISEARQAAEQHFADLSYPTDGVEFVEGEVTVTGRVDGVKVFEMNIKSGEAMFDQNYVIEQAGQQDLMSTDIEPREDVLKAQGITSPDNRELANSTYFHPLFDRVEKQFSKQFGYDLPSNYTVVRLMLDGDSQAWASILEINYKDLTAPRYLVYELGDSAETGFTYTFANGKVVVGGTIRIVPLMPEK